MLRCGCCTSLDRRKTPEKPQNGAYRRRFLHLSQKSGADDGAATAAVILGGAAIGAVSYAVGTQIWMETNLPDGVIPTSREQLALMLWNAAGRPQPAEAALYADISAEAADTQLAARWCVEQGLMKDYGESFKPGKYTFRWQVIKAWNRVQKMN